MRGNDNNIKGPWWWNDGVEEQVRQKKMEAYHCEG